MHNSRFFRKLSLAFVLAAALALTITSLALAQQGPVSEPPGGVTLVLTGNCTGAPNYDVIGECQGRTGGLNLNYMNFNFSQFEDLYWGAAYVSDVRLRLGGSDWFGYMSYRATDSNLPGGVAVFRGNTDIPLWNGAGYSNTYVDTRLTVVVTDLSSGNPLPLEAPGTVGDLITNGPLLHVTGNFRATILFQFYYGGAWQNALEAYDALHTPPTPGLVNSSFTPSFFYTDVPLEGLSATNDSPTPYGSTTILTATVLTGTNPAYTWDFGDGTLGSGAVTGHIYPATGWYTALVTATNEANVLTATTTISITEAPVVGLSASNDSPTHLGDLTTLQASVTGGSNITYTWALGDGALAAGQVVTHTYPSAGYYTALVTATNVLNQITATTNVTISFEVYLTDPAAHEFTVAPAAPLTVTFTGEVAPGTVSSATLTAYGAFTGPHSGSFSFPAPNQAALSPAAGFLPGELVTAQVLSGVQSTIGQSLEAPYQWQFSAAVAGGSGNFVNSGQSLFTPQAWRVALGDLDGDGDLDAVQVSYMPLPHSTVWLNDGSGIYTFHENLQIVMQATDVALGDLDGDGDLDAFISELGLYQIFFNDGSGSFNSGQFLGAFDSYAVSLGDLDGDGDLDAFVATYSAQPDRVLFNDGSGVFTDSGQLLGDEYGIGMALGDMDNDGDLDAYVANCHEATDKLWLNDGQGLFSDSGQTIDGLCSYDVDLGDVDGDGDLDVVVANAAAGGQPNQLYFNDGSGALSNSGQILGAYQSTGIALGDLDADGDLDLFYSTFDAGQHVWRNDGSGIFTDTLQVLGSAVSRGLALGDLDGDGDLDAFVSADGQPSEIWFNENSADLALAKSVSPGLPQPGHWITYTLSVVNLGPQTATGVQLVDQVPVSVTHASLSVSSSLPITSTGGPSFTWLLPDLPPGAGGLITITGQLSDTLPGGHTFTNTASLSASEWDLAPANNQSQASLTTNMAPLAAAGPDQDVDTGDLVTLDGRASLDPDGNLPLTYLWVQTSGPTISFNPALSLTTFTAPEDPVVLAFVLIVTDSLGQPSLPDPVAVTVHNQPPLADAGADQSVETLALVTLDGSGSDPDGDLPLLYLWTQTAGDPVSLSNPAAAGPTFTAPDDPGMLTFTLVVTDSLGLASAPDTVVITVTNQAPVADAGPDQSVDTLALVALDGSASDDPDNDALTYQWAQAAGPAVTLSDPHAILPTFTAPGDPGTLTFTLIVTDSWGLASAPDEVVITVANQAPVAHAGTDQSIDTLSLVTLDASLSSDPDGDLPLIYGWAQTAGPAVTLSDPNVVMPTFTAPIDPAVLTFTLVVTDALGMASAPDEVVITVNNQAPVADDQDMETAEDTLYSGLLTASDPDDSLLEFALGSAPAHGSLSITLNGAFTYTPTQDYHGTDVFTFTVTDGDLSDLGRVDITVTPVNDAPLGVEDAYTTDEDTLLTVAAPGVLVNDTDVDGDLLSSGIYQSPAHGLIILNPDGSFTYDPAEDYFGTDTFLYEVSDGVLTDTAWMTITINAVNDAPLAVDDAYATDEDVLLVVPAPGILGNDTDVDSSALNATVDVPPTVGSLVLDPDGGFIYAPPPNFNGEITFTYTISDGALTDTGQVTITVTPVNDAPVADAGPDQSVDALALVTLDGSASYDPDGNLPLTYQWMQTGGPTVILSNPGAASPTFTAPSRQATFTFTLVVTDNLGLASAPDEVIVIIRALHIYLPMIQR